MRKKLLLWSFPAMMSLASASSFAASSSGDIKEAATAVSNEPLVGSVQEALKEFKSLPRKDVRSRFKEVKKAIKEYKEQKKAGSDVSTNTLLQVVLAILIPPLAVYLHEGEINNRFWISLLLTILGFALFASLGTVFLGSLPGIIYALIVVLGG